MSDELVLAAVGVYVAKDLIAKLLGPTADYLGAETKSFVQKRIDNVSRIFDNAINKSAETIDQPGQVPPRVLRDILNEGSFQDDIFAVEYFGGILASSRSANSRDDSAGTYSATITRMSSYQIRAHYVFYTIVKRLFDGQTIPTTTNVGRQSMQIYVSYDTFVAAMGFTSNEIKDFNRILSHVLNGLVREGLIENNYRAGRPDKADSVLQSKGVTKPGIEIQPSALGIELFLAAHGSSFDVTDFLSPTKALGLLQDVQITGAYRPVHAQNPDKTS